MSGTATSNLTGAQKSAVVCLALGPEKAAVLMRMLSRDELEAVLREISTMKEIPREQVESVLREFKSESTVRARVLQGGEDAARRIAEGVLGSAQADAVLERVRSRGESRLARLEKVEPRMFASLLEDEHPQTIAVILTHLDIKHASKALEELSPELAGEVMYRMARMEPISPDVLNLIDAGLRSKTDLTLSQELSGPGDPGRVAKLLTMTGKGRDEEILNLIEERDEELAARVKALMFVFEDLLLVDKKGIQQLLRETDNKDLALALKGASQELRAHIHAGMSQRAADALEEEMDLLGPVRVKDVEEAQQRIMDQVRSLEEAGEIVIQREGDDEQFIA